MSTAESPVPVADLTQIRDQLRRFARDRDWDQFHTPKNLAVALSVEVGELLEHFLWITEPDSAHLPSDKREQVALEAADVLIYLVRLSDKLDIDLADAVQRKIALNHARYPIEKARGNSKKHREL